MADIAKALDDCEAAISWGLSAHASFWTAKALSEFSDFIVSTYRRKDGLRFRELAAFHNASVRERRPGGVCDMTLINLFFTDRRCVDLTQTISGGTFDHNIKTFDHNINMSDNRNIEFEMFRGIKRLTWRNSIPYGRPLNGAADVRFHALHCQGWAKQWISRAAQKGHLHRELKSLVSGLSDLLSAASLESLANFSGWLTSFAAIHPADRA